MLVATTAICPQCGDSFAPHHCAQKFCNAECRLVSHVADPTHICLGCGKRFMWNTPHQMYCGDPCVRPIASQPMPRKYALMKEVLIALAQLPGETLRSIGARFGCSRQRMDYIYKRLAINPPAYYRRIETLKRRALELTIYHPGMRNCYYCKNYLPLDDFTKSKHGGYGYAYICLKCNRDKSNAYYARKREEKAE